MLFKELHTNVKMATILLRPSPTIQKSKYSHLSVQQLVGGINKDHFREFEINSAYIYPGRIYL